MGSMPRCYIHLYGKHQQCISLSLSLQLGDTSPGHKSVTGTFQLLCYRMDIQLFAVLRYVMQHIHVANSNAHRSIKLGNRRQTRANLKMS